MLEIRCKYNANKDWGDDEYLWSHQQLLYCVESHQLTFLFNYKLLVTVYDNTFLTSFHRSAIMFILNFVSLVDDCSVQYFTVRVPLRKKICHGLYREDCPSKTQCVFSMPFRRIKEHFLNRTTYGNTLRSRVTVLFWNPLFRQSQNK